MVFDADCCSSVAVKTRLVGVACKEQDCTGGAGCADEEIVNWTSTVCASPGTAAPELSVALKDNLELYVPGVKPLTLALNVTVAACPLSSAPLVGVTLSQGSCPAEVMDHCAEP